MIKKIRYGLESLLLHTLFLVCGALPVDAASAFGGWIGRTIGPRLAASRKARANIMMALPEKTPEEIKAILTGMWDNLGRVITEYPHLEKICRERVELPDTALIETLRDDGQPAIIFTGHLANWEVACPAPLLQHNLPMAALYRAPNNPASDRLLDRTRSLKGRIKTIGKSKSSARQIVKAMMEGHHIGILIDQKYNEGLLVPFFGIPAKTSPAFVQLAQKFKCPLIPAHVERLGGARFRISSPGPLPVFTPDGASRPVEDVMIEAHTLLESWIRQRPEQWLWLHRRWPGKSKKSQ